MESLPNTKPADTQDLHFPTDLTASSGPSSASSTRETFPASSNHLISSTISSSSPKKPPSANSDRNLSNMKSPKDQSVADKKAPRDSEERKMAKHVLGQEADGSATLSHSGMSSKPNQGVSQTTSRWQHFASQNMIAVKGFSRAGRDPPIPIDQQNAEVAPNFSNTPNPHHKQNNLTEGSFGKLEVPYYVGHQSSQDALGLEVSGQDLHSLRSKGASKLHNNRESALAARSPTNGHKQSCGPGGEGCLGFCRPQNTLRAETLCNPPQGLCNEKGESQGALPDCNFRKPSNAHSTGEGHSTLNLAWDSDNVNENVAAAHDLVYAPANVPNTVMENHRPHKGLMMTQSLHDSHGNIPIPQNSHHRFANTLPMQESYHSPANDYDAGRQVQSLQHSHKDILAAQSYNKPCLNAGDAGGQGYALFQETLLAQQLDDGQLDFLEAQDLHSTHPHILNPQRHASLAPRKLYDAHGNAPLIHSFHRSDSPNVFDKPAQLCINKGSSDHVTRCLPTSHNSSATSAPSISADQTTLHPHHYHHHHNNSSTRTTPGFSSPVPSTFDGNELSINTTPYVSITNPFTSAPLSNNANNIAASSSQFAPFTDPSPLVDPSSSSLSATSSSSSNTYTATMIPSRGIVISDADMDRAVAYCFDRGNGQYTRLVPVDVLPYSLRDLPARVTSNEGMIVLPVPRMIGPDGQPANVHLEPHVAGNNVTPPVSPTGAAQGGSTDLIQHRIDNIVAAAPNATSGSIVLSRSAAATNGTGRREKVFCDKWIHDGTCAFTQQGCKFKHEMPMDKETQQSLGLFHGLPAWYRKREAERVLHLDDRPVPLGGGAVAYYGVGPVGGRFGNNGGAFGAGAGAASRAQNWRRIEVAPPTSGSTAGDDGSSPLSGSSDSRGGHGRGRTGPRVANYRTINNFGPIGPPSQSTGSLSGSHGGNRHRTNTGASFDSGSAGGAPAREAQRDDAAPRGGVRIANNPFGALEDYASASNTESDRGKGSDEALD